MHCDHCMSVNIMGKRSGKTTSQNPFCRGGRVGQRGNRRDQRVIVGATLNHIQPYMQGS